MSEEEDNNYCKYRYCNNHRYGNSDYCCDHKCNIDSCILAHCVNSLFCIKHVCKYETCLRRHLEDLKYCEDHICEYGECVYMRSNNSKYCLQHITMNKIENDISDILKIIKSLENRIINIENKLNQFIK